MRIDEILEERRPVFSFEFFPPKDKQGMTQLKGALAELAQDEPAYVSVTYGAGGSTRDRTVEVTKLIKQGLGIEAMAHLSCVGEPVSPRCRYRQRDNGLVCDLPAGHGGHFHEGAVR